MAGLSKRDQLAKRIWDHINPAIEMEPFEQQLVKRACQRAADDLLGRQGKRDLLFEALCEAMGADWTQMPKHEQARYNVAAGQLREIFAEPEEVLLRAKRYKVAHPDWELTPTALVTHWSTLSKPTTQRMPAQHFSHDEPEPEALVPITEEMVGQLRGMMPKLPRMYDD